MNHVNGIMYEIGLIAAGIAATGKKNPDSMMEGRKIKNDICMACCCVFATVEMKRPNPRVEARKRKARA